MFIHFHWRTGGRWHRLRPNKAPMPSLTQLVLTSGLAAALGIFAVSALWRMMLAASPGPVAAVEPSPTDMGPAHEPSGEVMVPPALPTGKVPVWFYRSWDLIGVALIYLLFALSVLYPAHPAKKGGASALDSGTLIANIVLQALMAGLVSISVVRRVGWVAWLGLRWPRWRWVFLIAPVAVVFMLVVLVGLEMSGFLDWIKSFGGKTSQEAIDALKHSKDPLVLALTTTCAVIVAPLCEEIVFRGYFYPVLKRYAGAWSAAVCVSLVFAVAHPILTNLLPIFILSGLLVYVYEKTGSLWASIAVHCCYNSTMTLIVAATR